MNTTTLSSPFDTVTLDQLGTVSGGRHHGKKHCHKRQHGAQRSAGGAGQAATGIDMASAASPAASGDDAGAATSPAT